MLSEANEDPVIGSLLDGRYRIIKLLGKGGMGNVYLADETRLRRRCALKVLHPRLADDRTHVERFLREAQTIAQFEHPNIVDIYSYGEEPSGVVFFAMELLLGDDLDARIKSRAERPFGTHDCVLWAIQIARAMAVVHDAGLIHRDLKTSNIFLAQRRDGEEIVKLLDFGIARPEEGSELTATGVALGTPSYMSPEQVRNTVVDRRSDIYSFGVLLFKLLTNRLPFAGDAIQVAMAHCLTPPPTPSEIAPDADISLELDWIVLRALAKDPAERPASMRELEESLTAILRAEAPELAPATRPTRHNTNPPRRPKSETGASVVTQPTQPPQTEDDAGTTPTSLHRTGPTSSMKAEDPGPPPRSRSLYMLITAGSVLSALLLLGIILMRGDGAPASATKDAPVVAEDATNAARGPAAGEPVREPVVATKVEPAKVEPAKVEPGVVEPAAKSAAQPRVADPGKPKAEAAPVDPLKQVERKALQCRKKFKAVDGPKITIDYATGIDGKVVRSIPSVNDELGKCLADAVARTQFEPKLVLGKKLPL